MSRRFGREIEIAVGQPGTTGERWSSDLRVDFRVKHTATREPNTADIKVYNWGRDAVELLRSDDDTVIRLFAGYDGSTSLLFAGSPREGSVTDRTKGAEQVTEIKADDGGRVYGRRLELSYARPITARELFRRAADALDLTRGKVEIESNPELSQGVVLGGPAREVLDRIATMVDGSWSIQDGRLRLLSEPSTGRQVAEFSAEAGTLYGRPEPTDDGLSLVVQLEVGLRPGDLFVVRDDSYGGTWRADNLLHRGSLWSDEFQTEIKASPV